MQNCLDFFNPCLRPILYVFCSLPIFFKLYLYFRFTTLQADFMDLNT